MKSRIKKTLGFRTDVGFNFYLADFFFRKILRQNADTTWAVHYTSAVICPQNIKKGKHVFPGDSPNNYIEAWNGIEIGDYTNIGPGVGILSANHDKYNNQKHVVSTPIKIGKHCWIGMNAIILPGVVLGDYTIVGAGSVVTKSFLEGHCVLGGNPAKIINKLDQANCFAQTK